MIGALPTTLEVGGRSYDIRSDFREILNIFQAFNDSELSKEEQVYVCLKCLYVNFESIPQEHLQEAVDKAIWFCDGGDIPKSKPEKVKSFDWEHDESILFPAISKSLRVIDVRALPYVHWWTFLGAFGEIDEGLFSTVMHIRQKKLKGKKLEKWEQEFYNSNKELINLKTKDDIEAEKETEEFLKSLLGDDAL